MQNVKILADETVSISDFRKDPSKCIKDKPIAVLKHNKLVGYVIGKASFEQMMAIIEEAQSIK